MDYHHYIADAVEILADFEIPLEDYAQAITDQAKIMAMTDIELSGLEDFASPYTPLQF